MIKNVTVIGAGLMGAGIAAHLTNAGTSVTLLDIPDDKSQNRNNLADQAVSKLIKICLLYTSPSPRDLSTSRMPSSA